MDTPKLNLFMKINKLIRKRANNEFQLMMFVKENFVKRKMVKEKL